jgi:predicted Zn finger-like uncharacterized protein
MPIQVTCPSCERPLRVPDELLGQQVKCPACQHTFEATAVESPSAPEDQPRPRTAAEGVREQVPAPPRQIERDDEDEDFDDVPRRRRDYKPHRATLILVLGIIALPLMTTFGLGFITAIPAWIMGNSDIKEMRAGIMDPSGESMTNAGRIIGMIVTILNGFGCLCGVVYIAAMIAAGAK